MKMISLSLAVLIFLVCGCSRPASFSPTSTSQDSPAQTEETHFQPFVVYDEKGSRGNHFFPSGFMPDGKCLLMDDTWSKDCYQGKTCIRFVYDVACSRDRQKWVGVYWLNPANNWGTRKGGFNLEGAQKLVFWAKGKNGGEEIEEFKMGGISGDYPDTDSSMIGPVVLTDEWREYAIDLRGKDISYISGGFAWSTGVDLNPEECEFYIDNIRYE